jgi:hypothetical protein
MQIKIIWLDFELSWESIFGIERDFIWEGVQIQNAEMRKMCEFAHWLVSSVGLREVKFPLIEIFHVF